MVLSNYMNACRAQNMKSIGNGNASTGHGTLTSSNVTGGYYNVSGTGGWVDVGYGDTAVSESDYKMADSNSYGGTQVGALTWVSTSFVNQNPYLKCYTTVYRNDGADSVTVKELGICGKIATTANYNYTILVARKVLDTPVVVPAGATVAFTYGIKV